MDLWLLRHGIAVDPADPACPPDDERPLTPKGMKRTERAVRGLGYLGVVPDRVLTSPLVRAVQTAQIAMRVLDLPRKRLRETKALRPGAPPEEIFRDLRRLNGERVLCVGHAPNLDRILARLVGSPSAFTSLKKAGAAFLDLRRIEPGGASLEWILPSRALRSMRKVKP